MRHLDEIELQAFHDGELAGAARQRAEAHLQGCPACRRNLAELQWLRERIHSGAMPDFSSEGAFWVRLAAAIEQPKPRPLSEWLPFVPSLAFGTIGSLLELALTVTFLVFGLSSVGLLPAPEGFATRQANALLNSPLLEQYLYPLFGGAPERAARQLLGNWQSITPDVQHWLLLVGIVVFLGALLAVSAAMLISCTAGWRMTATVRLGEKGK